MVLKYSKLTEEIKNNVIAPDLASRLQYPTHRHNVAPLYHFCKEFHRGVYEFHPGY